jgi:tRNA(Met) C34 N-acetyltransferase TmcA
MKRSKSSTLIELMESHEKQAQSSVRKILENAHYAYNPNDICWMLEDPQLQKQYGRARRIYNRLDRLEW